jgi:hypothetical protein
MCTHLIGLLYLERSNERHAGGFVAQAQGEVLPNQRVGSLALHASQEAVQGTFNEHSVNIQ